MSQELIKQFEAAYLKAEGAVPELKPGDTVRVKINLYEGPIRPAIAMKKIQRIAAKGKTGRAGGEKAERQQTFEGVVIALQGSGVRQKVTVRRWQGVGVEKTFFTTTSA